MPKEAIACPWNLRRSQRQVPKGNVAFFLFVFSERTRTRKKDFSLSSPERPCHFPLTFITAEIMKQDGEIWYHFTNNLINPLNQLLLFEWFNRIFQKGETIFGAHLLYIIDIGKRGGSERWKKLFSTFSFKLTSQETRHFKGKRT